MFPKGSAAGPSGMSPDILLQLTTAAGSNLLPALTTVVNMVAGLKGPDAVPLRARPAVYGVILIALLKQNGSIRPIACGDVLGEDLHD